MYEKNAYKRFRAGVIGIYDRCSRVENLAEDGMPDVNCCIDGKDIWLEMKTPTEPKRESTPLFGSNHRVLQSQMNWHMTQWQAKGKSFIYIETDRRVMIVEGKHADAINKMTIKQIEGVSVTTHLRPLSKQSWTGLKHDLVAAAL